MSIEAQVPPAEMREHREVVAPAQRRDDDNVGSGQTRIARAPRRRRRSAGELLGRGRNSF